MAETAPSELVEQLRATFDTGTTRPVAWRREQLLAVKAMLRAGEERLLAALAGDLSKGATEAYATEIGVTLSDLDHTLKHLDEWTTPQRVKVPVTQKPGRAEVVSDPYGVVLIMSPWNYPVHLVITPLVAAIAAGNAVLVKPSEVAPATASVLADLIETHLDTSAVAVVQGGPDVARAVLAERFDLIFFTGSTALGRKVMAAAAPHLTPVVLELGGKSPAIVDRSANLAVAARRIVFGKFVNAGQTCVAPDHVLVDETVADELTDHIVSSIADFYGDDPRSSDDFGRIVNERHLGRLRGLLDGGGFEQVVVGGEFDADTRYLAPTVLRDVDPDAPVMQEEIFGPILPVLTVRSTDEAIRFVNDRPKPLALYVFAEDDAVVDRVVERTSSGGVCANHTLVQLGVPDLPFGGVGDSGMGAYHGRVGFEAFSHQKSVLRKATRPDPSVLYPPYGRWKAKMIRSAV
ncbi:MAG: aldehyde dehydrogenase family protein [Acidimicrobiales bacterium]